MAGDYALTMPRLSLLLVIPVFALAGCSSSDPTALQAEKPLSGDVSKSLKAETPQTPLSGAARRLDQAEPGLASALCARLDGESRQLQCLSRVYGRLITLYDQQIPLFQRTARESSGQCAGALGRYVQKLEATKGSLLEVRSAIDSADRQRINDLAGSVQTPSSAELPDRCLAKETP